MLTPGKRRALTRSALALLCLLAPPAAAEPSAEEIELRIELELRREEMVRALRDMVEINTGSWNLPGLERFAEQLPPRLSELGFEVDVSPGATVEVPDVEALQTGPVVIARRAAAESDAPRFLVVAHYDTVFEPDSPFQSFSVDADAPGRAYGPGVVDMKGGIVVLLEALRALHQRGDLDRAAWTLVFNADEEIGSLGSRPVIEREARASDYGFVFESAQQEGALVRARRGLGQFHLRVRGVAAHAGNSHADGRSAILRLAEHVVAIEALTDYERGITLNVGTIRGGQKRNIVPASAEAWVDLRYDAPADGEQVRVQLEALGGVTDGTQTEVWGRLHRPPKLETPNVHALIELATEVALDLGVELPAPVHSGGGTDGSLMGAVGLATLDSLGVVGGAAHTQDEFVELSSLAERAAIAAVLFRRIALRRSLRPEGGGVD